MKIVITFLLLLIQCFTYAQENQNIEIAKIESGNFQVYKVIDKGYQDYKLEAATKPWPVEFIKDGASVTGVLLKRAGIIDEKYEADLPGFPAYFQNSTSSVVITVIDKKIYYYSWSVKTGSKIDYILTSGKPLKYSEEKGTLDAYRNSIKEKQLSTRSERIEENAAREAREQLENTLEGKEIKSIKVQAINLPANVGMLTVVAVGMEVTLTNGVILKTKNLGGKTPYTDFEANVKGGDFAGGDFKVANDSRQIPNDKIEISVWSKFDKNKITGNFSHTLNYKSDLFYNYQGGSGSIGRAAVVGISQHGGDGKDGKSVSVRVDLYKLNENTILKLSITDANSGQLLNEAKINSLNKVTLNVSGGNGGDGVSGRDAYEGNGGNGGNGGDGGNVSLTGSGVAILNVDVQNKGGRGGNGGVAKIANINTRGANGSAGKQGTLIK